MFQSLAQDLLACVPAAIVIYMGIKLIQRIREGGGTGEI